MRNFTLFAMAALFVLACSFSGGVSAPEITTASPTVSPTRTSTLTPTVTSTPRNTPTDVTDMLTQTALAPVQLLPGVHKATPFPTRTPLPQSTPSSPGEGFESVVVSESKLYWGICKPHEATMTVTVLHPEEATTVYLFFRLISATKIDDTSPWTGTVTDNNNNGTFTYLLRANLIPHRKDYMKAWFQYQFVAENEKEVVVGRTQIYLKNLTLEPCK
jgi:hypothetical protein